jgi:hypothetical protein
VRLNSRLSLWWWLAILNGKLSSNEFSWISSEEVLTPRTVAANINNFINSGANVLKTPTNFAFMVMLGFFVRFPSARI